MAEEKQEMPKIIHTIELEGPKPQLHIIEGTYKDKPMLNIIFLGGYSKPMSMGIGKVKMILHSLPEMIAFYNKYKGNLDSD